MKIIILYIKIWMRNFALINIKEAKNKISFTVEKVNYQTVFVEEGFTDTQIHILTESIMSTLSPFRQ